MLMQFNTGLEKNKLFLKGLPLTATKSDLEELFAVVNFVVLLFIPILSCLLLWQWWLGSRKICKKTSSKNFALSLMEDMV